MHKKILLLIATITTISSSNQENIVNNIGQLLMIGFHGTSATTNSTICKDIGRYNIGAVILFDYNPVNKNKPKNIANKKQLIKLTKELQSCSKDGKLLIAIDQEGGRVQRLKNKYGFYGMFPKASDVAKMNSTQIGHTYAKMSKELKEAGINFNLAPVVDLDINMKNHVIHGLGRSFGKDPKIVAKYASVFIDAMHQNRVLTSLKHFPGHGSSLGDTHKGFVDVTNLWKQVELEPYRLLKDKADTIMVAHVYNKNIDTLYPATLSKKSIHHLLRGELGYQGVVITDDLQMGAISKKFNTTQTLMLAINAGNDILLFGNQLDPKAVVTPRELISKIELLIRSKKVDPSLIKDSLRRVKELKSKL